MSDLDGKLVSRLEVAIVHVAIRHRNAWHSTTVNHHRNDTTVAGSFYHAARAAEEWRAAGSSFTIRQVPALEIISRSADDGPGLSLYLVDLNASRPFSTWHPRSSSILTDGTPMWDLVTSLAEGGEHALPGPLAHSLIVARPHVEGGWGFREGDTDRPDTYAPGQLLKAWQSSAPNHDEPLEWKECEPIHGYDTSKILEIEDLYRQVNELGPRDGEVAFVADRHMPLGRVLAGFIVLQRDDGTLFVYSSPQAGIQMEMPSDAARANLHDAITRAMTDANA